MPAAPLAHDPWPPPLSGDSSLSAVIAEFLQTTEPGAGRRELRAAISHVDAELGTMRIRAVRSRHVSAMLDGLRRAGLSSRRQTAVQEALDSLFAFAVARRLVAVDPMSEHAARWGAGPIGDHRVRPDADPTGHHRVRWDVNSIGDHWPRRDVDFIDDRRSRRDEEPAARRPRRARSAPTAAPAPAPTRSPTPTLTMFALGARVALWTTWIVTLVFVVLLLALFVELA